MRESRDYSRYSVSKKEIFMLVALYAAAAAILSLLFYNSIYPGILLMPGILVAFRKYSSLRCRQIQRKLNREFKEMLLSLSANMAAGYSIESAFVPVYQELSGMYQGSSYIEKELMIVLKGLEINSDVDVLLGDLAKRSQVKDIEEFANIVVVAKRSGGNLIRMMKKMVQNMEERIEVEDEIDTMLTAKRLEQNIMSAMPFVIILYLRVCNPGYMDVLYGNIPGAALMTVCLGLIVVTILWGWKIININV